ncbi:MAG: hypothetical protein FWC41_00595 [Firmicutes bacterium]|nr:hypothetical protein [Bacillota bacterium]
MYYPNYYPSYNTNPPPRMNYNSPYVVYDEFGRPVPLSRKVLQDLQADFEQRQNPRQPYNDPYSMNQPNYNQPIQQSNMPSGVPSAMPAAQPPQVQQRPINLEDVMISVNNEEEAWNYSIDQSEWIKGDKYYFCNKTTGDFYVKYFGFAPDTGIPKEIREIYPKKTKAIDGASVKAEKKEIETDRLDEVVHRLSNIEHKLNEFDLLKEFAMSMVSPQQIKGDNFTMTTTDDSVYPINKASKGRPRKTENKEGELE